MFVLRKLLFRHSFLNLRKVNVLIVCLLVNLFDFVDSAERYSRFLPQANEECRCAQENIRWQKGCYIEYKNFIAVTLQRYCSGYQDGNSQWFMENDGTDYVLITYS